MWIIFNEKKGITSRKSHERNYFSKKTFAEKYQQNKDFGQSLVKNVLVKM